MRRALGLRFGRRLSCDVKRLSIETASLHWVSFEDIIAGRTLKRRTEVIMQIHRQKALCAFADYVKCYN
ncbi:MAG: hypothetical protein K2O97_12310, partial [Acetatifactor sp.]|nr:hypothetical protein [Acetatifactor sp.]